MTTPESFEWPSRPTEEIEVRSALRRLASRANTEPTRGLGTYEMATLTTDQVTSVDRSDWRRLAVAAALVAFAIGGVVVLSQRNGDSNIVSSPVDPVPVGTDRVGTEPQAAGALGAGFKPVATARLDDQLTIQYQYARDRERPETGAWLSVSTLGTPGARVMPWLNDVEKLASSSSSQSTASGLAASTTPSADDERSAGSACMVDADQVDIAPPTAADASGCVFWTLAEIDGNDIAIMSSGINAGELKAAKANIVPAPDGFGYIIDPHGLPDGFSEIASGAIDESFEPRSALDATDRVAMIWKPSSPVAGTQQIVNPVLGSVDIDAATITAVGDGGSGLAGQRLGFNEIRDTTVGGNAAVVQIGVDQEVGAQVVALVWRHAGWLYRYEEVGPGADPIGTARRANELLPFIVGAGGDGQSAAGSVDATMPDPCYEPDPTAGSSSVTEPVGGDVCGPTQPTATQTEAPNDPAHHAPTTSPEWPGTEAPFTTAPATLVPPTEPYPTDPSGTTAPTDPTTTTRPTTTHPTTTETPTTTHPTTTDTPTTTYPTTTETPTTSDPSQGGSTSSSVYPGTTETTYPGSENGSTPTTPTTTYPGPDNGSTPTTPPTTYPGPDNGTTPITATNG